MAITSDGTGQGEVAHEVGRRALADHLVEKLVDKFLYVGPHRFAAFEGGVPGHHSAQPMMLGIVRPRKHDRCVVLAALLQKVLNGFRGQAWINQCCPDVVITAHRPGRSALVHHPSQTRLLAPARELRGRMKRAVGAAPGGDYRKICLGGVLGRPRNPGD
jgi:hypothetical protein